MSNRRKRKKQPRLIDYPPHLRGYGQNRWGGQQTQLLRGYAGKSGPASKCRSLSPGDIEAWKRAHGQPWWKGEIQHRNRSNVQIVPMVL